MTAEEYINKKRFQNQYGGCDITEDDVREAIKMARKEEREKLTWHDLRENPDDLPLNYPNLISESPSKMTHGSTKRVIAIYDDNKIRLDRMVKSYIRTQDGTKLEWVWLSYTIQKHVLAWMEIPEFKK